jgi:hypothetical protein
MPLNKILTIINTSHEVGVPRAFVIEGTNGNPSVKLGKLTSVTLDLYQGQLDEKFADTLYQYKILGYVNVLLDGSVLTNSEVGYLKYPGTGGGGGGSDELVKVGPLGVPDYLNSSYFARAALTHITPVQKINDAGVGLNDLWSASKISGHTTDATIHRSINDAAVGLTDLWSASKISGHTTDATIHRSINDAAVGLTDLWSASKITSSLSLKADKDHVHFTHPRVVFKEEFIGTGAATTFTLAGTILNGTFTTGSWAVGRVLITFPSDITGLDSKPTYDGTNVFTRHRVSTVSINAAGVVTLDYAPRNGIHFYIWYWYEIQDGDVVDDYIREDYVADMEETTAAVADDIPVNTTGFTGILSAADTDVQLALGTIDTHNHLSIHENLDIDLGTEVVDTFVDTLSKAVFWKYVVFKGANLRSGLVMACWDDVTNVVRYTETSTTDVGSTVDLVLSVDINANNVRLLATAASNDWAVRAAREII